jgi:hypothetical protein
MAGTLEHRVSTTVRSNAGTVSTQSYTLTGDHEYNYEIEDKSIGTDTQVDLVADVSTIVSLVMASTTAMTLETNAVDATGGNTITLTANTPVVWNTTIQSTLGTACPLTLDVTTLYVTNAAIGDLSIYILFNGA